MSVPLRVCLIGRAVLGIAAALCGSAAGSGQEVRRFDEYAEQGIVAGPDGAVWFALPWNSVGRIDGSGAVTAFPLPSASNSYPTGITVGSDGALWIADQSAMRICRLQASGAASEYRLTSRPYAITAGPDGALWFTEPAGRIGRITTSGAVTEYPVSAHNLTGITSGPDGNLWFANAGFPGGVPGSIGRITPSGEVTEFPLPSGGADAVVAGPDGNIWFTGPLGAIGRMSLSGELTGIPFPGGDRPRGIVVGADGNLWVTSPGHLSRITPSGAVTQYPVPIVQPSSLGLAVGPDGSFWMTDFLYGMGGQLVRYSVPSPSVCVADESTLCLGGGRFRVTTQWQTANGATGSGHASTLTGYSGYFWFFDPASVEVVVKVVNGCSSNGHYWVFGAGLTNVGVTTRVTDTRTGITRDYVNPPQAAFAPIQETSAFAACE